ncbi:GNAT family N-acetyltransferase [Sphaerisporangium dianthi]|uniref:GNAT family N-acetyltransferase n=1 Tax=Sphaerisporangium dianthi TaxID=1436120 RepID=A0ABV9CR43_9ACTN
MAEHLARWLGKWPGAGDLDIVGSPGRTLPGWNGAIYPAMGVRSPAGGVLSVPPEHAEKVAELYAEARDFDAIAPQVSALLGYQERGFYTAVYRWSIRPAQSADAGSWVAADDPRVPAWLRPFGGEVLVAWDPDTGAYLAGVGLKRHDDRGRELAVVTASEARGRGLARRLVAQAARRVLDEGAVPTYLHARDNRASAAVADAAGFPDRGWTAFGLSGREG